MKTFLFLFIIALAVNTLTAQQTFVPDDNFEQALIDLWLDLPPLNDSVPTKNINIVKVLNISRLNIKDLTGIENFKSLTDLYCDFNELRSFDLSLNRNLEALSCSNNYLRSIDLSNNAALSQLNCSNNNLRSLNLSRNLALTGLMCSENELSSLDLSNNTVLNVVYCYSNKLKSLDLSNNINLNELYCYNNDLESIDLSKNTALIVLYCNSNDLKSIDLSKNTALFDLNIINNYLRSLDLSQNSYLNVLTCFYNQITNLNLSKNTELTKLECNNNLLTSLDLSNCNKLYTFDGKRNPNLYCIQVKDSSKAANNTSWQKDDHTIYSEDCSLVSVEEDKYSLESISISPNPAEDYVEVNYDILSKANVPVLRVYDVLGTEHPATSWHPSEEGNIIIDVSSLPKGVYFLIIGDVFKKFIKI